MDRGPEARDMAGYAGRPPHPQWPGNARVAVQFVLHYQEGSERSVLHRDTISEGSIAVATGNDPVPDTRTPAAESLFEYGTRAGFWRLHRLFADAAVPMTVFGTAVALAGTPEAVAAMREAGWEVSSHGLRWEDHEGLPEEVELSLVRGAIDLHAACVGAPPQGWWTGRPSHRTRRLLAEVGDLLYDADSFADDLPFWAGDAGDQLVVPHAPDTTDIAFAAHGLAAGDHFLRHLCNTFDVLYAEGVREPKMMSVGLHPRISGRPGRIPGVRQFLDHVRTHERVWVCRRVDIARHWHDHHPPFATSALAAGRR